VSEAPPTIRQRLEAQENQIAQLLEQLSEVVKMGADIAEIKAQIGKAEIEAPEARKTL
jgi:chorismate mutase